MYYTLKDKFGDHGLVSVVIMKKEDDNTVFIDTWLMSCRVLKRGMEEFIINCLVDTVRKEGFSRILGEYLQTPKNSMVKDIYEKMGFTRTDDTRFELQTDKYVDNKTFIKRV